MIPASIPSPLMKFLKLRIDSRPIFFYNRSVLKDTEPVLNLNFQNKIGGFGPRYGPK